MDWLWVVAGNRPRDNGMRIRPMIRNAKDLSPTRRPLSRVRCAISVPAIEHSLLSDERRLEVLRGLEAYFAQMGEQR
jgi:hypothetical protein